MKEPPRWGVSFSAPKPEPRPHWRRNLFVRFGSDQVFLWTEWLPREVRRPAFSVPLGVSLVGAFDSVNGGVDLTIQRDLGSWSSPAFENLTRLGDAEVAAVFLGATFLTSKLIRYERGQRAASLSAEALLSTGLYVSVLKRTFRRVRPSTGQGELFVGNPQPGQELTSFPSGHAAGAFAVATVFAREYRDKPWLVWTAYGTAGLIALSRVVLGRHYPADVIAGAVIGNSIGRMVATRAGLGAADSMWTRFSPSVDPRSRTIALSYHHVW